MKTDLQCEKHIEKKIVANFNSLKYGIDNN